MGIIKTHAIQGDLVRIQTLLACATCLLAACTTAPSTSGAGGYALTTTSDGKLYRIEGVTGETWLVTGDRMQKVTQSGALLLEIGRTYFIERNRSVSYLGDGKFTEPVADYSALWN